MLKLIFLITVIAVLMAVFSGVVSADEPPPASKVLQVRLGNLEAAAEVAGTVTFELTDQSGVTQTAVREFQAEPGEPLEGLAASFTYQGPFRWRIHIADDDGRQLSLLAGEYPGYPYAVVAPRSSRLSVTDPDDSVVFLDFIAFKLEFQAIAVLKDAGMNRVHAEAGLDTNGNGVFDPDEVVNTSARPEDRLVRVTVPRLSSNVSTASFFIKLESPVGTELANLEGTWTFEGGESLAFDLDARQIRGVAGFYGSPKPSQAVSTVALPNPWDLTLVSLTSASEGEADFSFLLGRDLALIWAEIGDSSPAQEAQALVTVTDEDGEVVKGATVTVNGEDYLTDDFGRVTIFAAPGSQEAVIMADGFDSGSFVLELVGGQPQSSQVILYRPGPGPLESANGFLAEHWLTIAVAAGTALALAMLVLVLLTPSRHPQPAG